MKLPHLLVVLLTLAAGCGEKENPPVAPPPPGNLPVTAPPAAPADLNPQHLPHGETLTESSFAALLKTRGVKYTVVTIFAADCAPCIAESKHLGPLVEAWRKRKVALIGISADVTVARIDKFLTQVGSPQSYPMYLAPWFIEQHKIDGTPVLMLFKPDGTLLMKVSVDDTPEPLKALENKLDEVQAGSVETTPNAANDPGAVFDHWRIDQLDAAEAKLPEVLEARLKSPDAPKDEFNAAFIKKLGPGRTLPNWNGHANTQVELEPYYDPQSGRCVIRVSVGLPPAQNPASTPAATTAPTPAGIATPVKFFLIGDPIPEAALPIIETLGQ